MNHPHLTLDQIQYRCTEQSFTRGMEYFHVGAIGDPVLHGWTLSSTCEGTEETPYSVSVELMPTGIATTSCSCPYDYGGDCKHIVALLLTYVHTPDEIYSLDRLLTTLTEKPKETLLQVIAELLKRTPEMVPVVRFYADIAEDSEEESAPISSELGIYTTVIDEVSEIEPPSTIPESSISATITTYREQVDRLFGDDFLEGHHLHQVLAELEGLVAHAESLARTGEREFALSVLHAVIHQSIVRYSDALQSDDLPRFVSRCTNAFTQIASNEQELSIILEHCRMLLNLSFEAERSFTLFLTCLIEQLSLTHEMPELPEMIEQHLDESPNREAHVQLLVTLYYHAGRFKDYLRLVRYEGKGYQLVHALFTLQQDDAAWKVLQEFSLTVDEYWLLMQSPAAKRNPDLTPKLLRFLGCHYPKTAILVYHKLINQTVLVRKRQSYEAVCEYLTDLKALYQQLEQEQQWTAYLTDFRKEHSRKRLLLQIIAGI